MEGIDPAELLGRALSVPAVAEVRERLGTAFTPRVWLVGGAVRDLLIGRRVLDLDLVLEGPLDLVLPQLGGQIRSHERFATATLALEGVRCDLAEARRETYAHPGALPDVEPSDIRTDLNRRDFTVNAIALELTGEVPGSIVAIPGALEDLERRHLRVLHDRSFEDDPTRLLRLARYAARLDMSIEAHTRRLAGGAARGGALATVSGTRIGNELRLLAADADPVKGFLALRELGLDEAIEPGFGLDQQLAVTASEAIALLPDDGRADLVVLALALRAVDPERRTPVLDALGCNAEDRDRALTVARRAASLAAALERAARPSEIAAAVAGGGPELVAAAGALGAERAARAWLENLRYVRLQISGKDILEAGVEAGPGVGRALAAAHAAALDGRAVTREEQLAEALRAATDTG